MTNSLSTNGRKSKYDDIYIKLIKVMRGMKQSHAEIGINKIIQT